LYVAEKDTFCEKALSTELIVAGPLPSPADAAAQQLMRYCCDGADAVQQHQLASLLKVLPAATH
tara:strand:+ start:419 stop:610 length:192 start_codon:yes stop_codon:yes gene_type:complete